MGPPCVDVRRFYASAAGLREFIAGSRARCESDAAGGAVHLPQQHDLEHDADPTHCEEGPALSEPHGNSEHKGGEVLDQREAVQAPGDGAGVAGATGQHDLVDRGKACASGPCFSGDTLRSRADSSSTRPVVRRVAARGTGCYADGAQLAGVGVGGFDLEARGVLHAGCGSDLLDEHGVPEFVDLAGLPLYGREEATLLIAPGVEPLQEASIEAVLGPAASRHPFLG